MFSTTKVKILVYSFVAGIFITQTTALLYYRNALESCEVKNILAKTALNKAEDSAKEMASKLVEREKETANLLHTIEDRRKRAEERIAEEKESAYYWKIQYEALFAEKPEGSSCEAVSTKLRQYISLRKLEGK